MTRFAYLDLITAEWIEAKPETVHPAAFCPAIDALREIEERLLTLVRTAGPHDDPERWARAVALSLDAARTAIDANDEAAFWAEPEAAK